MRTFNARTGQPAWTTPPNLGKPVTGAPGGLFVQYGGVRDLVLVGTRDGAGANALHGLSLTDGVDLSGSPFTAGGTIGAISGSPADRLRHPARLLRLPQPRRAARRCGASRWRRAPSFAPCSGWTDRNLGDIDGSPVLRNGRVYVGNNAGIVYSVDAATGGDERTFATGDGAVKGFVFPDRRNDDLIFATTRTVWSISDNGSASMPLNWQWTVARAEPVGRPLLAADEPRLRGQQGRQALRARLQLRDTATPPTVQAPLVLGDGLGQLGAPSLDIGVEPPDVSAGKKLLVVGSESGVLYGVEVPFP